MDNAEVEKIIREYLPQIIHMSLATSVDGKPWVCEVHYAFDDDLNLYWQSQQAARHSQEVAKNANVSGTIVVQHFLNQKARGVSFEGTAEALENVGADHPGFLAYTSRYGKGEARLAAINKPDGPRLYKITVSDFYLVDGLASEFPQKHHLSLR